MQEVLFIYIYILVKDLKLNVRIKYIDMIWHYLELVREILFVWAYNLSKMLGAYFDLNEAT